MLMSSRGRAARLHYLSGSFRVLSAGDHVVCAVTGQRIALDRLRYWSAARQEAYINGEVATARETGRETGPEAGRA